MGGSNYPTPPSGGLPAIFAGLEAKVAQQAGSPNASYSKIQGGALEVTDKNGTATISAGEYTFTSGPWSGKTINSIVEFDGLGNPQIILGPQPDGTDGLGVYNQLGVKLSFFSAAGITQYDDNGNRLVQLGTTGLTMFDTAGNPRSITGLLPSGDYGLAVYSQANDGTYQEVLPQTSQAISGAQSISVLGPADLATAGPSITATVGASGSCVVTGHALLTAAPSSTALVYLMLDGVQQFGTSFIQLGNNNAGSVSGDMTTSFELTGLSPGAHVFKLEYGSSTGTTASFAGRSLSVQPL